MTDCERSISRDPTTTQLPPAFSGSVTIAVPPTSCSGGAGGNRTNDDSPAFTDAAVGNKYEQTLTVKPTYRSSTRTGESRQSCSQRYIDHYVDINGGTNWSYTGRTWVYPYPVCGDWTDHWENWSNSWDYTSTTTATAKVPYNYTATPKISTGGFGTVAEGGVDVPLTAQIDIGQRSNSLINSSPYATNTYSTEWRIVRYQLPPNVNSNTYGAGEGTNSNVCSNYGIVTKGAMLTFSEGELKAVLAHEVAHIVNADTMALIYTKIGNGIFSLIILQIKLLGWIMSKIKSLETAVRITDKLFEGIFFLFLFLLQIRMSVRSRKAERRADTFAVSLGYGEDMVSALYLLEKMSLSGEIPIIEKLLASHPRVTARIAALELQIGVQEDPEETTPENKETDWKLWTKRLAVVVGVLVVLLVFSNDIFGIFNKDKKAQPPLAPPAPAPNAVAPAKNNNPPAPPIAAEKPSTSAEEQLTPVQTSAEVTTAATEPKNDTEKWEMLLYNIRSAQSRLSVYGITLTDNSDPFVYPALCAGGIREVNGINIKIVMRGIIWVIDQNSGEKVVNLECVFFPQDSVVEDDSYGSTRPISSLFILSAAFIRTAVWYKFPSYLGFTVFFYIPLCIAVLFSIVTNWVKKRHDCSCDYNNNML